MLGRFLVRTAVSGLGLLFAILIVGGIRYGGGPGEFIVLCVVFGLVNAIIRPILKFLSCPLVILTLGIFTLIINGVLLLILQSLAQGIGIDFVVEGLWPGILGAIVISIVSIIANILIPE